MIPERTCVGCGQRALQPTLIRFVRGASGLTIDVGRRAAGRGAYLHRDVVCGQRFARGSGPVRSLRWTPPAGARAALVAAIESADGRTR